MGTIHFTKASGLITALALAGSLLISAAPAQAAQRPIDVTGFTVSNMVVSSSDCHQVKVTMKSKKKIKLDDWWISTNLSQRGRTIDSAWFDGHSTDYVQVCPPLYGLGAYTLGASKVSASWYGPEDHYGYQPYEYSSYWDETRKTFYIRGKTKSSLTAKRSGSTVTLTAKVSVYAPEKFRWAQYNPTAKLQVKSGKTWKTVKNLKLKNGKAIVTLKDKKKKTYRVTAPQVSWATSTTTKSVTK